MTHSGVMKFTINDKVELILKKYNITGTIRFIGEIPSKQGIYYGIKLNKPKGKNNGSVFGLNYFKATQNKGIFVRKNRISKSHSHKDSSLPRVTVGDRVYLSKYKCNGIIRYIGTPDMKNGIYYGIELETPIGKNNGTVNGRWYFQCSTNCGIFVRASSISVEREVISENIEYDINDITATFFAQYQLPKSINEQYTSDNEFGNDASSCCGYSSQSHNTAFDDKFENRHDDILYTLNNINENELKNILMKEQILYESLTKVYSSSAQQYIDVAGLLTANRLYLISAIKYQLWIEFTDRTKINQLIEYKDLNSKISPKVAMQMVKNLDLLDDNESELKIMKYLSGKTKKDIKLNLLLNPNAITSLAAFFELKHQKNDSNCNSLSLSSSIEDVPCWLTELNEEKEVEIMAPTIDIRDSKHIIIHEFYNSNVVPINLRTDLLEYMFDDIPWIDENKMNNSIVITLKKYVADSVIMLLNKRKKQFSEKHKSINEKRLIVSCYDNNKITCTLNELKIIDLKEFNNIKIKDFNHITDAYGFCLQNTIKGGLTFQLNSNNNRHEWMTYLDYNFYNLNDINECKVNDNEQKTQSINDNLMNDFSNSNYFVNNEEYSSNFNFGKYLNYWDNGYKNSVKTKYKTLKHELLNNNIAQLSKNDYYDLVKSCIKLKREKGYKITAKNIGINNKKFNIAKGSPLTLNHLISLKVYTDFGETQKEFKKHCRQNDENESIKSFAYRNSEIAHWSRYLNESCQFYGTLMKKKHIVYTGLKNKLLFGSLKQNFQCPLSTTTDVSIAQNFCDGHGIILALKAANSKTRCFDMSWLSHYEHECEKLIMGSCMKIIDIYIKSKSSKKYISALALFEQIIDGQFIYQVNTKTENILYELMTVFTNKSKQNNAPPQYIIALFENIIKKMKKRQCDNDFWINQQQLQKINRKLKTLFYNSDIFNINMPNTKSIQQFEWIIENENYKKFKNLKSRKCIVSKEYKYKISNTDDIKFHLECCSKYSDDSSKCALFLHLHALPLHIQKIRLEYDVLCDKKFKYSNTMEPQWLWKDKNYCGFQTFSSKCLDKNSSIKWKIGIKIIDIQYSNIKVAPNIFTIDDVQNAIENEDRNSVLKMFRAVMDENKRLKSQNIKMFSINKSI